ncbi:MAG: glycosyl transferase family 36 [Deltaproteobacteria bacterium]|nr:glycosyl transferase family 36 [Deltaproteobacteria bacterium]
MPTMNHNHSYRNAYFAMAAFYVLGAGAAAAVGMTIQKAAGFQDILIAALLGVMASGIIKFGILRQPPTWREALQDILIFAMLAASANPNLKIWQAPAAWPELLAMTNQAAAVLGLFYLVLIAYTQATTGCRLSLAASCSLVLIPFMFNILLLLESPGMLQQVGSALTLEIVVSPAWRQGIGQMVVIFVFNEAVTACLHLILTGRLNAWRMHLLLAISAAAAGISPALAELGSGTMVNSWPVVIGVPAAIAAGMLAQAGLWAQTYLITGMFMDALHGQRPAWYWGIDHFTSGFVKGAVYSGLFMALIHAVAAFTGLESVQDLFAEHPLFGAGLCGVFGFPLIITVIDSFDGSKPFIQRLKNFYNEYIHALRGLVVGIGVAYALTQGITTSGDGQRFIFGFVLGATAYAFVNLIRDLLEISLKKRYKFQSFRIYLSQAVMGGLAGGALAWYFDAPQLSVVIAQFKQYSTLCYTKAIEKDVIYPLFSKWGAINLGPYSGGVGMLYNQSLGGVINWSIAAPLFSLNLVALNSLLQRRWEPLKNLFTRQGLLQVIEQAFRVQRWGLWMAPIISSFLKMVSVPTWYNQDGAFRTMTATVMSLTITPEAFRAWSLQTFTSLLAYDWFRILIYFDHMGLRVATLVNLSFIGLDMLNGLIARFCGLSVRSRVIPSGLRRFATWTPLLLPFYIPRGKDWDYAWGQAQAISKVHPQELFTPEVIAGIFLILTMATGIILFARRRPNGGPPPEHHAAPETPPIPEIDFIPAEIIAPRTFTLANGLYTLTISSDGRGWTRAFSQVRNGDEIDITRRSDDPLQQGGKFYYLNDLAESTRDRKKHWSLTYQPVRRVGPDYEMTLLDQYSLYIVNTYNGIKAEAIVRLEHRDPVEKWTIRLTNLENRDRSLELTSCQEWALNSFEGYRRHPDYNNLHVGTWFIAPLQAIFAGNRHLKDSSHDPLKQKSSSEVAFHAAGVLSGSAVQFTDYEDSRLNFLGHRTPKDPVALDKPLRGPTDQGLLYTFAPMAALRFKIDLPNMGSAELMFVDGYADHDSQAVNYIQKHLDSGRRLLTGADPAVIRAALRERRRLHGFGAPENMAPEPDSSSSVPGYAFDDDRAELKTHWNTARPWAHIMANELGYGVIVNNEGDIFSFMGNSQQNALTPAWMESIPVQTPGQALYLVDTATGRLDGPSYLPAKRNDGNYEVTFGRGYAVYHHSERNVDQELTIFVPPDEPLEIRVLKIRNQSQAAVTYRIVLYMQMVLGEIPEDSRWGVISHYDEGRQIMFFANERNNFQKGWAFVTTSLPVLAHELLRPRFLGGPDRDLTDPFMVEHGFSDEIQEDDGFRIAALVSTLTVAAGTEVSAVMLMGQANDWEHAIEIIGDCRCNPQAVEMALERTKNWWVQKLSTLRVQTNDPAFDRMVNDWLPYQTLVSRLWGRTGPNQRSGGYGYRDQLQDTLPFLYLQPELARRQILFHAAQQFHEGDVMQWWHKSPEGKTGLGARNRASDPHLWLPYLTYQYIEATGDAAILDEEIPFQEGETIPYGEEGVMFAPLQSRDAAPLYEHCLRAINFSLKRLGSRGLPLMGTGDWNDGMNLLGFQGRGQSVWLGFFLYDIISHFAPIIEVRAGKDAKQRYMAQASKLKAALETMWRDDRYARAITDNGEDLVFADALTAAWPIISRAVDLERGARALDKALQDLVKNHLVLLLAPPFTEESKINPGRLSTYPPGVRENGGQYSHGSSWLVDALAQAADLAQEAGDQERAASFRAKAVDVWTKISPLSRLAPEVFEKYGLPPHQQPADVYFGYGYEGRGGWSWYTGSAARMLYSAYLMLGLKMEGGRLETTDTLFEPKGRLQLNLLIYNDEEYRRK